MREQAKHERNGVSPIFASGFGYGPMSVAEMDYGAEASPRCPDFDGCADPFVGQEVEL
jgi:hypothetical protein